MAKLEQSKELNAIANKATEAVSKLLDSPLRPAQAEKVAGIIEQAVIEATLEGLDQAIETCHAVPAADRDMAHKIADRIREQNVALIANLSALR